MNLTIKFLITFVLMGQFNSNSNFMFGKLFSIFGDSQTPEEKFWNWFGTNHERIQSSIFGKKGEVNRGVIEEIGKKVKGYNKLVTWEMGKASDGVWELIISSDGIKEGIPFVEKLVNSAPKFPNWRIIKFRQPKSIEDTKGISYEGLSLKPDEIMMDFEKNNSTKKYDIVVFIKNYSKADQRYLALGFLHLDAVLGEYNVMTKVGNIDFLKLDETIDKSKLLNLTAFQKAFNKQQ